MDTHRVQVFHGADLDDVPGAVPHDLELNLLPAGNASLDQHLTHPGEVDAPVRDFPQGRLIIGDAAAGAAQGIGRPHDHRVADLVGKGHSGLHTFHHVRRDAGLADGFHAVLEALTVLRLMDGFGAGAQQAHPVLLQRAVLVEGHSQVQPRLPAQGGQNGIGPLPLDHLGDGRHVQRLDVHMVGDVLVGHDGGGVGVDQHHLHPFLLQGPAGLGSGVVELSGLADHNGTGAKDQNLFDVGVFRHGVHLP